MLFSRRTRAASLLQLIKASPAPGPLLLALRYHLDLSPSDPDLTPDIVAALGSDKPSFLLAALSAHSNPAVIELAFSEPSSDRLAAALRNPHLSDDQFDRIAELYAADPDVSLVPGLLKAAARSRLLPALLPEHLLSALQPPASRRQFLYTIEHYSKDAPRFAAFLLERYLADPDEHGPSSDTLLSLLDPLRRHLSSNDQGRVVDAHLSGRRIIGDPASLAAWVSAVSLTREQFRSAYRLLFTHLIANPAPLASSLPVKTIIEHRPLGWSIPDTASALLVLLNTSASADSDDPVSPPHRFADQLRIAPADSVLLKILAGHAPLSALSPDRAGAHRLLEDCGLFTPDELRSAGVHLAADELNPFTLLRRALPAGRLHPEEVRVLRAALDDPGLSALLDPIPALVVFSSVGLGSAGLNLALPVDQNAADDATDSQVIELSPLITDYLLSHLGSDPARWTELASVLDASPKISLGALLARLSHT